MQLTLQANNNNKLVLQPMEGDNDDTGTIGHESKACECNHAKSSQLRIFKVNLVHALIKFMIDSL